MSLLDIYSSLPYLTLPFFLLGFISLTTYVVPIIYQIFTLKEQNLKEKYNAKWALVTGGSSGIGYSIVQKLASQNINVVIAALEDNLLSESLTKIKKEFPNVQFRAVGVDLGATDPEVYMKKIREGTEGLGVNLVFNNAGYIKDGFFADLPLKTVISNYNCNATSSLYITHHFVNTMIANGQKGLVAFTSSSGGFIPAPLAAIYSSTKSFITYFAASLAGELKDDGIDVLVVHPSPIMSRFYNNANMAMVKAVTKLAAPPSVIASVLFKSAGRITVIDQGWFTVALRVFLKVLDPVLLAEIMVGAVRTQGDYKKIRGEVMKKRGEGKKGK
ncbi:hypothetical protein HK102_014026 [Quaeritorhiza haematococci]|nr:hypothetical protein HK102_014026 [Quaeritorhiza haematococci]